MKLIDRFWCAKHSQKNIDFIHTQWCMFSPMLLSQIVAWLWWVKETIKNGLFVLIGESDEK